MNVKVHYWAKPAWNQLMHENELVYAKMGFYLALRQSGVTDKRILNGFETIAREDFIPDYLRTHAYGVHPIEINEDLILEDPQYLARCIQQMDIPANAVTLEIGSGTGYTLALMSKMSKRAIGIERRRDRAHASQRLLEHLHFRNTTVIHGKSIEAAIHAGPFDRILCSVAFNDVPEDIVKLLKPGGILIIPVLDEINQTCMVYKCTAGLDPKAPELVQLFPAEIDPAIDRLG